MSTRSLLSPKMILLSNECVNVLSLVVLGLIASSVFVYLQTLLPRDLITVFSDTLDCGGPIFNTFGDKFDCNKLKLTIIYEIFD